MIILVLGKWVKMMSTYAAFTTDERILFFLLDKIVIVHER